MSSNRESMELKLLNLEYRVQSSIEAIEDDLKTIDYEINALQFALSVLYKRIYPEADKGEIPTYPSKEHEGL